MNNLSSRQRNLWVNYPKTYIAQRNPRNPEFSGCEGFLFATLSENTIISFSQKSFDYKNTKIHQTPSNQNFNKRRTFVSCSNLVF